jgi:hypothetical protein
MYFVGFPQTPRVFPNSINWLVCVLETEVFFWAAKIKFLYETEINVRPRRVNEVRASDVAWIKMAYDAAQGRAVVHTIVKPCPIKCGSLKEPINGHFPKKYS